MEIYWRSDNAIAVRIEGRLMVAEAYDMEAYLGVGEAIDVANLAPACETTAYPGEIQGLDMLFERLRELPDRHYKRDEIILDIACVMGCFGGDDE